MANDLPNTLQRTARRFVIYVKEYGQITLKWLWKVFKSWRYTFQKYFAKRKFNKMLQHFGSEAYVNLIKEGKSDWTEMPSVRERIEMLKLTEANVTHFDRLKEDLEKHFELQKLQIRKNAENLRKALPDLETKGEGS